MRNDQKVRLLPLSSRVEIDWLFLISDLYSFDNVKDAIVIRLACDELKTVC